MSSDDDYWSDELVLPRNCTDCARIRPCVWCVDPYLEDIDSEIVYGWWCADCHIQACLAI